MHRSRPRLGLRCSMAASRLVTEIKDRIWTPYRMDAVIEDPVLSEALRRLEREPEVYFYQALAPTSAREDVYTYTVPPNGDLVTRLTVRGSAIREVRVEIMGEVVLTRAASKPNETFEEIPVLINLLRLGYHRATVRVAGADVELAVTFKLLSDIAERRRIGTSEPLFKLHF